MRWSGCRGARRLGTRMTLRLRVVRPKKGSNLNTGTKVGAYLAGLVVAFAAAVGVGSAVGPIGPAADPQSPAQTEVDHGGMDMDGRE
jgi:hypothetical protein